MNLTDYHAKYFAHELTKQCPSDSLEKLVGAQGVPRNPPVPKLGDPQGEAHDRANDHLSELQD